VDVPVPQIVGEIVQVPTVVQHARHHHIEVEQIVDVHLPVQQEEIVQVSVVIPRRG